MTRKLLLATSIAAMLSAACFNFLNPSSTNSTSVKAQDLAGSWASIASATTLQNTCTDFRWSVTEVSGNTGSGTFSATCLGTLKVTGTGQGTLSGTTITWTATATAAAPGIASCPIALTGTAKFEDAQLRVPYSGTTCLGPVSGTEILRK